MRIIRPGGLLIFSNNLRNFKIDREELSQYELKDMTKPSISHHLDLLKQADLVASYREGQFIFYSLNTTMIDEIIQWFLDFKTAK